MNVTLRAYRILQMRSHKHKRDSGRRIWSQMVDSFVRCTVGVHADTILADINVCLSFKPRHKSALSLSWLCVHCGSPSSLCCTCCGDASCAHCWPDKTCSCSYCGLSLSSRSVAHRFAHAPVCRSRSSRSVAHARLGLSLTLVSASRSVAHSRLGLSGGEVNKHNTPREAMTRGTRVCDTTS